MDREHYEDSAYWRQRHFETCCELGSIINEQQDKIVSLMNENNRLKHNRGKRK